MGDPVTGNGPTRPQLERQIDRLEKRYEECDLCAHECDVDRTSGELGLCREDDTASVGSHGPHFGEEPPLSGTAGSGTVFLGSCNLGCVFCQNWQLSQHARGTTDRTPREIADIALDLEAQGCHNVNFVSPTHVAPSLARAVLLAREEGLSVPVVWNCGGFENETAIRDLDGLVDIYMPDVKWADDEAARNYSKASGYWDAARSSLREMHRQVGDLRTDADGLATQGLLVRHLVMPGFVENAKQIVDFLVDEISPDTYCNVVTFSALKGGACRWAPVLTTKRW
ncbi:radical SAM protein [Halanaeroarchaeum sulfurireducens]|uniref:Radical SAM protein n=1 Tax=Halanaeroarchaeum sulfurireducens TaxID=1604004 RepID=A0A0F7PB05_9EURY|nr:radical SAM protein [Halanaeroarchaeum sulfurireducens]AKH97330.1 radical SAM protein [Halanaeroarchaeum sulfurireducens]ALG81732.1 radical SAM protein [Halanaeroarchaeum sulfurireducens]